jgi:beta-N-acetylhexosaminidase
VPPPATAVRRRRAAVLAAAAAAFVLGLTFGAQHEAPTPRLPAVAAPQVRVAQQPAAPTAAPDEDPVSELTLQEQVGKLLVLRFAGTSAPAYVRNALRHGWAAGVILFRDNIGSPQQLKTLTRQLRKAAGKTTPIICTDQEGGSIRNVTWAPPGNAQAGQVPGRDAAAAAKALKAAGLNVSLAPVADVPSVDGAALGGRAFSRDPARAAKAVAAAVDGWRAGGMAATAKHFPGLGGATVNTDRGSATIAGGAPTPADLAPFKAAIAARVPLIMSSHARYPRLDSTYIASQSRTILDTLLRKQLGYEGVVMTDSIEAAAVRATGSTEQAAVRSVRAGNDIVLTTGDGSWLRSFRALLAEARASDSFRERVKTSAARVLALQNSLT